MAVKRTIKHQAELSMPSNSRICRAALASGGQVALLLALVALSAGLAGPEVPSSAPSRFAGPGDVMATAPIVSPAEACLVRSMGRRARSDEDPPWFGSPSTAITPEIEQLSRGLRHDPRLIYEHVRNFVDFVPMYGSVKGATMTLLDGEGTDFDQTSLFLALLRESGFTNCAYVYGTIQLNATQVTNWLGIANKAAVLEELLGAGGIPAIVTPAGEAIDHVVMDHVWAEVEIGGTNYVFDPSFKQHRVIQGVDVPSALGYDRNTFVSNAVQGMITGPSYVQNMNRANLRADLGTYASNLMAWLSSNRPAASLSEVIGGREIEPVTGQPFQTALPYELTQDEKFEHIPEEYETWIGIGFQVTRTFTVSQVYGKRLCMLYARDGGGLPRQYWILDGERFDDFYDHGMPIILNVDHPYPAFGGTYGDESREFQRKGLVEPEDFHLYYVSTGWGSTGRRIAEKHRDLLAQVLASSAVTNQEAVVGEALALIGLEWMAEASYSVKLASDLSDMAYLRHHIIGVVGQEKASNLHRTFMNMVGQSSPVSRSGQTNVATAAFYALTQWHSALEWGVIDQMQPGTAVSTIRLLDLASEQSNRIFNAESATYATEVRPNLTNYPASDLEYFDAVIANGWRLVLGENGMIQAEHYHGSGYYEFPTNQPAMSCTIAGGLNGGVETSLSAVNPRYATPQMTQIANAADHPQSAEPVDLLTGHYLDREVDLTVGSGGLPFGLAFARSYNSGRHHTDGPLGRGWSHNLDITAGVNSDAFRGLGSLAGAEAAEAIAAFYISVDLLRDGPAMDRLVMTTLAQRWLMDNLISNVVNVVAGEDTAQFLKRWDGSYTPTPGKWAQLGQDDTSFRLTSKHGVQFDFDTAGKLTTWRDPNSNTVSFSYADDLLTSVTNHLGRSLHPSYDTHQHLVQVADHTGRKVTYAYDGDNNLTNQVDPVGNASRYECDVPGRLTRVFHPSDPVTPFVVNEYAEAYILHEFDPQGEGDPGEFRVYPAQVLRQTAFNGQSNTYFYAASRGTQEMVPEGYVRSWEFDERAGVICVTDALTNATTLAYDGIGRLVRMTRPEGQVTEFVHDARDSVTQTTAFPKPGSLELPLTNRLVYETGFNLVIQSADSLGRTMDFTYDARGNLAQVELPALGGLRPAFDYTINARGQVTAVDGPEGCRETFGFNPATGDLTSRTFDPGGLNLTTQFAYDAVGNLTNVTDALGHAFASTHDANRQLVKALTPPPFSHATEFDYDADGNPQVFRRQTGSPGVPWQTASVSYNLGGQPVSQTDSLGRVTTFQYDNRLTLWKLTSPAGHVTEYHYDALSRPSRLLSPLGGSAAANAYTPNGGVATVMDGNSNRLRFNHDGFGRLQRETYADDSFAEFTYDPAGNTTQVVTRAGSVVTFAYDALDRLVSRTLPGPQITRYEYDLLDRLTNVTRGAEAIALAYDAAGRLTSITDAQSRTVAYAFDANGNRTRMVYPDGYVVRYAYDALNRLTEIREGETNLLARYSYDALSRATNVSFGNGVTTDYAYLPDDEIGQIVYRFAGGLVAFDYAYNAEGLLAAQDVTQPELLFLPSAPSGSASFVPNGLNQYASVAGQAHAYDLDGNLVSDGTSAYQYDAESRLVAFSNLAHSVQFAYDALGRRVRRTVNGAATEWVHDGPHALAEYDASGNLLRRYVHGPGLDDLVQMQTPGGRFYFHQDRLSSVIALSDASGQRLESFAYSPYGQPSQTSTQGNPFLFNGREYEAECGLYYHRARYYSPSLGRYLSADPIGLAGGDVNGYAFAGNDPANVLDPFGLCGDPAGGRMFPTWTPPVPPRGLSGQLEGKGSSLAGRSWPTVRASLPHMRPTSPYPHTPTPHQVSAAARGNRDNPLHVGAGFEGQRLLPHTPHGVGIPRFTPHLALAHAGVREPFHAARSAGVEGPIQQAGVATRTVRLAGVQGPNLQLAGLAGAGEGRSPGQEGGRSRQELPATLTVPSSAPRSPKYSPDQPRAAWLDETLRRAEHQDVPTVGRLPDGRGGRSASGY